MDELLDHQVMISVEQYLLWKMWMTLENNLRQAYWQQVLAQVVLPWRLPVAPGIGQHLTEEEEERFEIWKAWYIYQPVGFDDERVAERVLGIGE